jgi:dienelactone hydrolase
MRVRWSGLAAMAMTPVTPIMACPGLLPSDTIEVPKAAVTAQDLVTILEVGGSIPGSGPELMVSPAGDEIAFVVRRADPARNSHCVGLVVLPLGHGARPVLLDSGNTLLRDDTPWMGLSDMGSGRPLANRPVWSSDGSTLYYLKAVRGVAQVWRVTRDGLTVAPVTNLPTGVVRFGLAADRNRLLVWARPGLTRARADIASESEQGWVYDERFWTVAETRPLPLEQPLVPFVVNPSTNQVSPASPADVDHASRDAKAEQGLVARSQDGRTSATLEPAKAGVFFAQNRLVVRRDGKNLPCPDMVCSERVWAVWIRNDQVFVLREADADRSEMALVRWKVGTQDARTLWRGEDLLSGCSIADTKFLCVHESATRAPSVLSVDLLSGGAHTLLNLNPELPPGRLGSATRLTWRDAKGTLAYGDFVLPTERRSGEKLPLIVVQYESRGFLRGGTGDEYPIHALARAGYAVLSIHQPRRAAALAASNARTIDEYQRTMVEGHMLRKRMAAALDAGVDAAIATGLVDPSRIGLTGMSDGAATACYALIHRPRYAAIALSGGCEEAETWTAMIGPAWSKSILRWGMPDPQRDDVRYWDAVSLSRNVDRVKVPILIQVADRELRGAVQSWTALKAADRPVEMIVYPDEYHNKWQPAHRLAVYRTNLRWFDYWLRGREEPGQEELYARWRQLMPAAAPIGVPLQ